MDCLAEKVPEIASAYNYHRVTVAVLVCFPPKPFYFPDVNHLDHALQNRIKAARKKAISMGLKLTKDGQIKDVRQTYDKPMLPGYNYSVPVQELLREPQWQAYRTK